jgi:hypothetical protein
MKSLLYIVLSAIACLSLCAPAAAAVKIKAVVDKSQQMMHVYDATGREIYTFCASTGKVSSYSRVGTFHPYKFYPGKHYSGSYGGSMIDSVYYDGNRAIHGVDEPKNVEALCKYGTSFGCVHISKENAHTFYNLTKSYRPGEVQIIIRQ